MAFYGFFLCFFTMILLWKWKLVSDLLYLYRIWFELWKCKWKVVSFLFSSVSPKGLQHSFCSSSIDHSHICNFPILYWRAGICSWEVNSKVKCICLACVRYKLCNLLLHFNLPNPFYNLCFCCSHRYFLTY